MHVLGRPSPNNDALGLVPSLTELSCLCETRLLLLHLFVCCIHRVLFMLEQGEQCTRIAFVSLLFISTHKNWLSLYISSNKETHSPRTHFTADKHPHKHSLGTAVIHTAQNIPAPFSSEIPSWPHPHLYTTSPLHQQVTSVISPSPAAAAGRAWRPAARHAAPVPVCMLARSDQQLNDPR